MKLKSRTVGFSLSGILLEDDGHEHLLSCLIGNKKVDYSKMGVVPGAHETLKLLTEAGYETHVFVLCYGSSEYFEHALIWMEREGFFSEGLLKKENVHLTRTADLPQMVIEQFDITHMFLPTRAFYQYLLNVPGGGRMPLHRFENDDPESLFLSHAKFPSFIESTAEFEKKMESVDEGEFWAAIMEEVRHTI